MSFNSIRENKILAKILNKYSICVHNGDIAPNQPPVYMYIQY